MHTHVPMQVKNITFVSIFFIYSHNEPGKLFLTGATFFWPPPVYLTFNKPEDVRMSGRSKTPDSSVKLVLHLKGIRAQGLKGALVRVDAGVDSCPIFPDMKTFIRFRNKFVACFSNLFCLPVRHECRFIKHENKMRKINC